MSAIISGNTDAMLTRRTGLAGVLMLMALSLCGVQALASPSAGHARDPRRSVFGPNTYVFTPSTPLEDIRDIADRIARRQVDNQFGTERYALLFAPGTYGTDARPLHLRVGYYTTIAGLGVSPRDVVIRGTIQVRNRCINGACVALDNFWRSLSNLTIAITDPRDGCGSGEIWAASQAAPVRRLNVTGGDFLLTDTCSKPSWASGGFIADSSFSGVVDNGGQQQYLIRDSRLTGFRHSNWNQVFSGVIGAPAPCEDEQQPCDAYTTLEHSPLTREAPYLYRSPHGGYAVFVPALRHDSAGTSWADGPTPGASIPLQRCYIATPADDAAHINHELELGRHLVLTPGVYRLTAPLRVVRAGTVVLGLGMPTLLPQHGDPAMVVSAGHGVSINGVIFDAGSDNSPELLRLGAAGGPADQNAATDPSALHDVFFRIGGPAPARAAISLVVNSDHALIDHVWAWRADHGSGVGWDRNPADTGVVVNGGHVVAYGLFVEHYQKHEVLWNGDDGTVVFFQNEMPYDPPSQAAWNESATLEGYPALEVNQTVTNFHGYAFGSYSYFNQGVDVFAADAFRVPAALEPGSLRNVFTIFLNAKAAGGIRNVVNGHGGSSTKSNPDIAVRVRSFP